MKRYTKIGQIFRGISRNRRNLKIEMEIQRKTLENH